MWNLEIDGAKAFQKTEHKDKFTEILSTARALRAKQIKSKQNDRGLRLTLLTWVGRSCSSYNQASNFQTSFPLFLAIFFWD